MYHFRSTTATTTTTTSTSRPARRATRPARRHATGSPVAIAAQRDRLAARRDRGFVCQVQLGGYATQMTQEKYCTVTNSATNAYDIDANIKKKKASVSAEFDAALSEEWDETSSATVESKRASITANGGDSAKFVNLGW